MPARIIWLLPLILLALIAACDDGEEAEPTATPTVPQPTPTAPQHMDSFRAFAAEHIAPAIVEGDAEALLAHPLTQRLTCDGGPEDSFAPCEGLPEGTVLEGIYVIEWAADDVRIVPVPEVAEDFAALFRRALTDRGDQFGDGRPRLYALAAKRVGDEGGYLYQAVVTAMQFSQPELEEAVRVLRVYEFSVDTASPTGWILWGVEKTDTLAADWLFGGCADCYDYWERWSEGSP